MRALDDIEAEMHVIPPCSPDLNHIEDIFHTVKNKLECDAISKHIKTESFNDFENRIINVLDNLSVEFIDRTIISMHRRINAVIKCKGFRIKD